MKNWERVCEAQVIRLKSGVAWSEMAIIWRTPSGQLLALFRDGTLSDLIRL